MLRHIKADPVFLHPENWRRTAWQISNFRIFSRLNHQGNQQYREKQELMHMRRHGWFPRDRRQVWELLTKGVAAEKAAFLRLVTC